MVKKTTVKKKVVKKAAKKGSATAKLFKANEESRRDYSYTFVGTDENMDYGDKQVRKAILSTEKKQAKKKAGIAKTSDYKKRKSAMSLYSSKGLKDEKYKPSKSLKQDMLRKASRDEDGARYDASSKRDRAEAEKNKKKAKSKAKKVIKRATDPIGVMKSKAKKKLVSSAKSPMRPKTTTTKKKTTKKK